jgi:hypothetical protein
VSSWEEPTPSLESSSSKCWPDDPDWPYAVWVDLSSGGGCYFDATLLEFTGEPFSDIVDVSEPFKVRFRVEPQPRERWQEASGTWSFDLHFAAIGRGEDFTLSDRLRGPVLAKEWRSEDNQCVEVVVEVLAYTLPELMMCDVTATVELLPANDETEPLTGTTTLGEYRLLRCN